VRIKRSGDVKIREIEARTILVRSKLPDADYVVNPYTGCEFGCLYCYASSMGRFVGEPVRAWGDYVYVKTNAVSLLEGELRRWSPKRRRASLLLSSVTDPYHGVETRYRLTRGILTVLAREGYPGVVSILTKSPLVLRDVDLLQGIPRAEVGMTVTTTDDTLSRFLEVRAPLASRRLSTLDTLHARGITTYAFVGPLLPHFRYQPRLLEKLFERLAATGIGSLYVEHLNLRPYIRERLWHALRDEPAEVREVYGGASTDAHRQALDALVNELVARHGLRLRLAGVLDHGSGKRLAAARPRP
jgi:DNA repair photolyase